MAAKAGAGVGVAVKAEAEAEAGSCLNTSFAQYAEMSTIITSNATAEIVADPSHLRESVEGAYTCKFGQLCVHLAKPHTMPELQRCSSSEMFCVCPTDGIEGSLL